MSSTQKSLEKIKLLEEAAVQIVDAIEKKLKGRKVPILIALDGRSGTGKTTLAKAIASKLDSVTVILGDDFYAGGTIKEWAKKTAEEKADQVIDWKRMRKEVLEPLLAKRIAKWHPFNWDAEQGLSEETIVVKPASVIILDGAYSARPELADLIDFSVLVQADDNIRRGRLKDREGEPFMKTWHPVYDEAEDYYFSQVRPPSEFDLVVTVSIKPWISKNRVKLYNGRVSKRIRT